MPDLKRAAGPIVVDSLASIPPGVQHIRDLTRERDWRLSAGEDQEDATNKLRRSLAAAAAGIRGITHIIFTVVSVEGDGGGSTIVRADLYGRVR